MIRFFKQAKALCKMDLTRRFLPWSSSFGEV